uniref:Uncharacterized protein n=1 Tax=Ixodes ricinus TaxID=34613 RepID=A0A6B0USF4_IXORI
MSTLVITGSTAGPATHARPTRSEKLNTRATIPTRRRWPPSLRVRCPDETSGGGQTPWHYELVRTPAARTRKRRPPFVAARRKRGRPPQRLTIGSGRHSVSRDHGSRSGRKAGEGMRHGRENGPLRLGAVARVPTSA